MANKYDAQMEKLRTYFLSGNLEVSSEVIDEFEREIGFTLPEDYREFLSRYGLSAQRGYPTWPDIRRPGEPGGGVDWWYGLNPTESRDLLRNWKGFRGRIPSHLLPIAESPGGQICLCLAGEKRGKLFWWDRSEPHAELGQNLTLIAHDFDTFINSLWLEIPGPAGK
jgi:SMI1 / KNR4 family (SUKH-1)